MKKQLAMFLALGSVLLLTACKQQASVMDDGTQSSSAAMSKGVDKPVIVDEDGDTDEQLNASSSVSSKDAMVKVVSSVGAEGSLEE